MVAMKYARLLLAILALGFFGSSAARAQGNFYAGKNLEIYIGYTVGGGYDIYARLLSRHLGKHIPGNPTVIVKNMEGAGSLRLANWLYNAAPKDGTVIGTISRGAPFDALLDRPGIQFQANKYSYIGSANDETSVCVTWHASGISTFDDLKTKEVVVGAAGASADDDQFPRVMNGVLGTKMKVVTGYPGGNDVAMALERGEVGGRCGWSWSSLKSAQASWLEGKKINVLAQIGLSRHPDLVGVPLVTDFAKNDEERKILELVFARQALGRPFLAPPDVPQARIEILRKAFMQTMKDPDFLAEADRAKMEIRPLSGQDVQDLVARIYRDTDPKIAKKAASLIP